MKIEKMTAALITIICVFLSLTTYGYAQSAVSERPPNPKEQPARMLEKQPVVPTEKIAPGIFRIGEIQINKKLMLISFPAKINMDKGLLEYLLVRTGGKTHESLFSTDVDPYNLQIAHLLLGFEGTDRPIPQQGSQEIPKGDPLEIYITYHNSDKKLISVKSEDWISINIKNEKKSISKIDWVFTGSVVYNGQFLAQSTGSIVALYHDPAAIIDNASEGGESDERWYAREGVIPPVGTPVTINFKAKGIKP